MKFTGGMLFFFLTRKKEQNTKTNQKIKKKEKEQNREKKWCHTRSEGFCPKSSQISVPRFFFFEKRAN